MSWLFGVPIGMSVAYCGDRRLTAEVGSVELMCTCSVFEFGGEVPRMLMELVVDHECRVGEGVSCVVPPYGFPRVVVVADGPYGGSVGRFGGGGVDGEGEKVVFWWSVEGMMVHPCSGVPGVRVLVRVRFDEEVGLRRDVGTPWAGRWKGLGGDLEEADTGGGEG